MFMGLDFHFQVEKESSTSFIRTIQNKVKKKLIFSLHLYL